MKSMYSYKSIYFQLNFLIWDTVSMRVLKSDLIYNSLEVSNHGSSPTNFMDLQSVLHSFTSNHYIHAAQTKKKGEGELKN